MKLNAFQRHEERLKKLNELSERYKYEALLKLASDLKKDAESLLRILAGEQGIDPELGRQIEELYQKIFGKLEFEAIEQEPIINECSVFSYKEKDILYDTEHNSATGVINHHDILIDKIKEREYDNALNIVRNPVNRIVTDYFKKRNAAIDFMEADSKPSVGTNECPGYRKYILEVVRFNYGEPEVAYYLEYKNGKVRSNFKGVENGIVNILRNEGKWEE